MRDYYYFFVPGPLPNLNDMLLAKGNVYRGGKGRHNAYSKMKDEIEKVIRDKIVLAGVPQLENVFIHFHWREARKNRDPDNVAAAKKFIIDAMVHSMSKPRKGQKRKVLKRYVLDNDGWSNISGFIDTFSVDPGCPGVDVFVYDASKVSVSAQELNFAAETMCKTTISQHQAYKCYDINKRAMVVMLLRGSVGRALHMWLNRR